jgi:hypothetical protein
MEFLNSILPNFLRNIFCGRKKRRDEVNDDLLIFRAKKYRNEDQFKITNIVQIQNFNNDIDHNLRLKSEELRHRRFIIKEEKKKNLLKKDSLNKESLNKEKLKSASQFSFKEHIIYESVAKSKCEKIVEIVDIDDNKNDLSVSEIEVSPLNIDEKLIKREYDKLNEYISNKNDDKNFPNIDYTDYLQLMK